MKIALRAKDGTVLLDLDLDLLETDRELAAVEDEVAAELRRREGASARHGKLGLLGRHPDLLKRMQVALAEAERRRAASPPLKVKAGDTVTVNGCRFAVVDTKPDEGRVQLEAVVEEPAWASSRLWCDGAGLEPDAPGAPPPPNQDTLRPPDSIRDGYERARFVMRRHREVLAGRVSTRGAES